ncbi:MAG: hypothetical protein H6R26_2311 [Proteobacteria bacterium]|nr:hypothetical protein [Pseudomonadota bacterium]
MLQAASGLSVVEKAWAPCLAVWRSTGAVTGEINQASWEHLPGLRVGLRRKG